MSNLSGRIPNSVEWDIEELLEQYQDNITSILGQFPALQVSTVKQGCKVGVGLQGGGGAAGSQAAARGGLQEGGAARGWGCKVGVELQGGGAARVAGSCSSRSSQSNTSGRAITVYCVYSTCSCST